MKIERPEGDVEPDKERVMGIRNWMGQGDRKGSLREKKTWVDRCVDVGSWDQVGEVLKMAVGGRMTKG